jgi:DNA-binding NarL/FixJ family response regulator
MTDPGILDLERGRECYGRQAWARAFEALTAADQAASLGAEDLERLAMSAYLIGLDDDYLKALERAHDAHVRAGELLRAARCAFWLGLRLLFRGEVGHATGWLARTDRLIEDQGKECVECGYLLLPAAEEQLQAGDAETGYAVAAEAVEIAERFEDHDLLACARQIQGRALLQQGQLARGLTLLDEAMVAVVAGNLSPIVTGLVYCSVIAACQQVYAVGRAHEWTLALAHWCEEQPELVAFSGTCLLHRAEILQFHGAWGEAIAEARRACERCATAANRRAEAAGYYQAGEVHRLRGEFAQAEDAYRNASRCGQEPQPGLALLRLAQRRTQAAVTAIRRVAATTQGKLERTKILPAVVDTLLAAGDREAARDACRELEEIAVDFDTDVLNATAANARGAVLLEDGEPHDALLSLRCALQVWQRIDAPYQAARTRVLVALACRALGDDDGTELELEAARAAFEQLEASPDLARVDSLRQQTQAARHRGLTHRELQVLRLLAAGKTNKDIAGELRLSDRTIDRHVSNIFGKLDVTSRTAATSYAYRHELV